MDQTKITNLVQLHHAAYREDIPFWTSFTEGRDPLLEIGCGHGRVFLPLLESGRQIVGVDNDQAALDFLRNTLREYPPEVRNRANLVLEDILNYHPERAFGAALIPCNTITTFDPSERGRLFSRIVRLLVKGGMLAASMPNPAAMLEQIEDLNDDGGESDPEYETSFSDPETGHPIQVSSRLAVEGGGLRWEWIYDQLFPDGRVERLVVPTVHYPGSQRSFLDQLAAAGFSTVECLGDFRGDPYREDSPCLILLAVR